MGVEYGYLWWEGKENSVHTPKPKVCVKCELGGSSGCRSGRSQLSSLHSQSHRTEAGLEACLGGVGTCQMHVLLRARGRLELRG